MKRKPKLSHFALPATGGIFVLIAYIFFISLGTWTTWFPTTAYYDHLAASFMNGKLWLQEQPDPRLLELSNPYDPEARAGIPYPQDVSLYKGKFYLYFGPVPAVIMAVIKFLLPGEIGDQYLVFGIALGIFCLQTGLLLQLWKRFFSTIPAWMVGFCILVTGLISPSGWALSLPSVYYVAIMGGQFFFLAGLYVALHCLIRGNSELINFRLGPAGLLWVAAIGSRITQIIPIAVVVSIIVLWILSTNREQNPLRKVLQTFGVFGMVFGLGMAGLGWYNWARFDSVFETGIYYQLAGRNLQRYHSELFSPIYVIQNFYNYFLIHPTIHSKFPFLSAVRGSNNSVVPFIELPEVYFSQETVGLFYTAPFLFFSIIPLFKLRTIRAILGRNPQTSTEDVTLTWVILCLLGSSLSSLLLFLSYFWVAVRFQGDILPPAVLLSVLGFWQLYHQYDRPAYRSLVVVTGLLLMLATILSGNLVAFSIASARYREVNPELWRHLVQLFR